MPSDQNRGAAIRSTSSLLILPPRRPSSAAATKLRVDARGSRFRSTSSSRANLAVGRFDAARPATAPSGPVGSRCRRPLVDGSKEAGSCLPSLAQRTAGDVLSKDGGATTNAAYLARGTDFICSNFTMPEPKSTSMGRGVVRSSSTPAAHKPKASVAPSGKAREDLMVQSLMIGLNLPEDSAHAAYDVFKRHADASPGKSFVQEGRLTRDQFAAVLRELTGAQHYLDLPYELIFDSLNLKSGLLDFREFAIWFSSRSFHEYLNLDADQRSIRRLARKYNMPVPDVEKYKKSFDEFDIDRSGAIKQDEFQHLLYKLSKVPEHIGLPPERVHQLFVAADADKSTELDFEEFLVFHKKYFNDAKSGGGAMFQDYYRSVRRCSAHTYS